MNKFNGDYLIKSGVKPGLGFKQALERLNQDIDQGICIAQALDNAKMVFEQYKQPDKKQLQNPDDVNILKNIDVETQYEQENLNGVLNSIRKLSKTPFVKTVAILPDACPVGEVGNIPVGTVVESEKIHPGMHSADVCCSVAISIFDNIDPKSVLDAVNQITHFGPSEREQISSPSYQLMKKINDNQILNKFTNQFTNHFMTQGDGNHFAFVGTLQSTGQTALVTHHGSRGGGASLYKVGVKHAINLNQKNYEPLFKENYWIEPESEYGELYWSALQIVREWCKENHFAIHNHTAAILNTKIADRFWNEHNFVFRKSNGLFYHAKGSTPAFNNWSDDATQYTLIPLNMASPVLITKGNNNPNSLGFSPHGAGRNFSRSEYLRILQQQLNVEKLSDNDVNNILKNQTKNLDIRFFNGIPDVSELPGAYKDAQTVEDQITKYNLATIVDKVLPYGTIMAGHYDFKRRNKK